MSHNVSTRARPAGTALVVSAPVIDAVKRFAVPFDPVLARRGQWPALVTLWLLASKADSTGAVYRNVFQLSTDSGMPVALLEIGLIDLLQPDLEGLHGTGPRVVRSRSGFRIVHWCDYNDFY